MDIKEIQLVDGLRQLYVPKLNEVTKTFPNGTRYWLANSNQFIAAGSSQRDYFELTLYDINEFLACWAGDIARMTCASAETVAEIGESHGNKKFLAWQIVEYYYSAFYAAHSTLKICGLGLVQLDKQIIRNIKRQANTFDNSMENEISDGIYCVNINVNESKIIFYRVKKYDDSHRGLWKRYIDFIDVLCGSAVLTGQFDSSCIRAREPSEEHPSSVYSQMPTSDAQIIIDRIESLKTTINKHGDSNWLSWVRNSVNYNQAFGIWFPYTNYNTKYNELLAIKSLHLLPPLSPRFRYNDEADLLEFAKCCQNINSINYEIILDLAKRHPQNKSFLASGPLKLFNLRSST